MKMLEILNAKIGSDNVSRFSNGNIHPLTAMPHGMSGFCIQTDESGGNWFYNPNHRTFEGIRLTHQPSPWVGDYGHMIFMPMNGTYAMDKMRYSSFRPNETIIKPNYLKTKLMRYDIDLELSPTERGGIFRCKHNKNEEKLFAIIPFFKSNFEISNKTITGQTTTPFSWGAVEVTEYFYIEFSSEIELKQLDVNGGICVIVKENSYTVKVATSFISVSQAKQNFVQELEKYSFDEIKTVSENVWEKNLGVITVSDENEERKKIFYSCMYRALLFPRKFYEIDETGKMIHFNPDSKKVHAGFFFTDNGFWDTYRTVYPLLSIINPKLFAEMVEGFVNFYEETGYLPKWISPGEIGIMPGTLIEAVLADAIVKNVIDEDLEKRAYKGMLKNAFVPGTNGKQGRIGCADYLKYNYLPRETNHECVNNTLDCAYGDFCISQVSKKLNDTETYEALSKRSKNYSLIFDKETGFMRGKDKNGNFKTDFCPHEWGGENCEGSYWQNSFAVYHDFDGLAQLYGGKANFIKKLDELFAASPEFSVGYYGIEIHEMSEMAAVDFGQCAISNQPSFHIPYIYSYLGDRKKTENIVENLVKNAFTSLSDGFPGDEDNGTMASWFIFSCLGFYPICPGKAEYVASKPLFDKIEINGKEIIRFEENIIPHEKIVK